MESRISRTLQILRGIELIYPNEKIIKLIRLSIASIKNHKENDPSLVLKNFFKIFKQVSLDSKVRHLEKLCQPSDHLQSIVSTIALTSQNNVNYEILYNLKSSNNDDIESNLKVLLSFIDEQEQNHKLIKDIILIDDELIKIQKVIQYFSLNNQSYNLEYIRKLYANIHEENFDHHVWNFLYQETGIYLFDRIKVINLKYPQSRLHEAFSKGQIESKLWILSQLNLIPQFNQRSVHILCGWYALAAYLIYNKFDDKMNIRSYDIDTNCLPISCIVNHPQKRVGLFMSWVRDIYTETHYQKDAVLINTSCEHLTHFDKWFSTIPQGQYLILQTNNYFDCEEHSNCMNDLEEFKRSAPLSKVLYQGELKLQKYSRFMLIGIK